MELAYRLPSSTARNRTPPSWASGSARHARRHKSANGGVAALRAPHWCPASVLQNHGRRDLRQLLTHAASSRHCAKPRAPMPSLLFPTPGTSRAPARPPRQTHALLTAPCGSQSMQFMTIECFNSSPRPFRLSLPPRPTLNCLMARRGSSPGCSDHDSSDSASGRAASDDGYGSAGSSGETWYADTSPPEQFRSVFSPQPSVSPGRSRSP